MNSDTNDLYVRSVAGNNDAITELFISNHDMIWSVARSHSNKQFSVEELASEGWMAFMNIVTNDLFKPMFGVKFSTYLYRCLNDRALNYKRRFKHIMTNKSRKFLDIEVDSIDKVIDDDTVESLLEVKTDKYPDSIDGELAVNLISQLTEREKDVLLCHFKITGTVNELVNKHGITRQRLDQVRSIALSNLKKQAKEYCVLNG
jgi:RNA polymerase sigma factor (sigma-70 family)